MNVKDLTPSTIDSIKSTLAASTSEYIHYLDEIETQYKLALCNAFFDLYDEQQKDDSDRFTKELKAMTRETFIIISLDTPEGRQALAFAFSPDKHQ